MSGLGEQIAVLDGLTIAPGSGMHGGGGSYPDSGRWPLLPSNSGLNGPMGAHNDLLGFAAATYPQDLPNQAPRKRVFASYSGSANYSGGSSYPDGGRFPTWAQGGNVGLAGFGAASYPRDLPNIAPRKRVLASPSGGANYGGGSSYPDSGRFPTWTQPAGMAGLGRCGCQLDGLGTMPNVLPPGRVFASAPQGANYSGGSAYPDSGRFPLLSSTVGLADVPKRMPMATREQLMAAIQFHGQRMVNARKVIAGNVPVATKRAVMQTYIQSVRALCVLRAKAGLPALPECQQLIARMKAAGMARGAR
jgi:hypothetical protein